MMRKKVTAPPVEAEIFSLDYFWHDNLDIISLSDHDENGIVRKTPSLDWKEKGPRWNLTNEL